MKNKVIPRRVDNNGREKVKEEIYNLLIVIWINKLNFIEIKVQNQLN